MENVLLARNYYGNINVISSLMQNLVRCSAELQKALLWVFTQLVAFLRAHFRHAPLRHIIPTTVPFLLQCLS